MPLQATSGAASYDAFGGGVPVVPNYIEDVFSTWLYTGNDSTQTITNGIDLSTKGGLVWQKSRNTTAGYQHVLYDTVRGSTSALFSSLTNSAVTSGGTYTTTFNTTGFTTNTSGGNINQSGFNQVSWTFRKQPKFFDVVTYTATGSVTNLAHNLGSVPGCIIIKNMDDVDPWVVYHQSIGATKSLRLNTTAAETTDGSSLFNSTTPTSTVFTIGTGGAVNFSGNRYVAYLFAHNAGGFGLTGTDNVISCGAFTTDGSGNATVTLGYEPQWALVKTVNSAGTWWMMDTMRGWTANTGNNFQYLQAQSSSAEGAAGTIPVNATGFTVAGGNFNTSETYIYIAIRRPMKVPTVGTSVFGLSARTGTGANATVTGGAGVSDAVIVKNRGSAVASLFSSRLTRTGYLVTSARDAEVAAGATILQSNPWDVMDGVKVGTTSTITNASGSTFINYLFKRAPSVFDEICYTGNGVAGRTLNHNLGVAPELVIIKSRSLAEFWPVITTALQLVLNLDDLGGGSASVRFYLGNNTIYIAPTSSTLTIATDTSINSSGATYVAYLFATCAGVSKVGSYTGNGSTQTINCGFTSGARFVLIKRTDTDGDWYVWDTARGIVAGNDPHLSLNTTAAEVTTDDTIDTDSTGFVVNQVAATNVNVSSATYIFLAIA